MPSLEHVRRAKAAMNRVADLEFFFEKLTSPGWIEPLEKEGFFKEPWAPVSEGRYVSFPFWPQSKYLARMAAMAPDTVLEVIQRIPNTDNVRIHEDYADAALSMPPNTAAKILPLAKSWLSSPYLMLLPMKLGHLLRHLAVGGETAAALDLAAALLTVIPNKETSRPHGRFEDYSYGEILEQDIPPLLTRDPLGTLRVLANALEQAVMSGAVGVPGEREDYSASWRPAVEEHAQNNEYDVRPLLVAAVRDAATIVVTTSTLPLAEVFEALDERPWKIFSRIGHHLVGTFPDLDLELTRRLAFDTNRAGDPTYHHEYWRLALASCQHLSQDDREVFLQRLETELEKDEREAESLSPDIADQEKRRARYRLFRRLSLLRQALPPSGQLRWNELKGEFSEVEHPEFLTYTSGVWTGPTSPKSSEELSAMAVEELVEYLRNWRPTDAFMGDSEEGLARKIAPVVAENPELYATRAMDFCGLDPTYVRSLIDGLRQARRRRHAFDWEPVLDMCEWIVTQPRSIPGRIVDENHDDLDPDWGWTRKEIAGLLEDGFEEGVGALPQRLRGQIWSALSPLTSDPDPTPEHEARYGGSNMNPLALSINSVRGVALYAVVKYSLWVRRYLETEGDTSALARGLDAIPEVQRVLEDHLRVDLDPSLSTRAVFGQWLPWLHRLDPNWTLEQLPHIFPRSDEQRALRSAAWGSYLLYSGVFNNIFHLLRDEYAFAIERIGQDNFGGRDDEHPDLRLVDHLMIFYIRGLIELRDERGLLQQFYRNAPIEYRERGIRFVGSLLHNESSDALPAEVQLRLQALFDMRLKNEEPSTERARELAHFGWWFASGKLPQDWAVSRLITVLRTGRQLDAQNLVVKQLAVAAQTDPISTSEALLLLVLADSDAWGFGLWVEEGRVVLERALAQADPRPRDHANRTINLLAARGNRAYVDLLTENREAQ